MKLTKWLRAEDLEGIEKHGMSVYRSIIFTVAMMTALMLVMLFAHQATAGNWYKKWDLQECYNLNHKEFKRLYKSGEIRDTIKKERSYPMRYYKVETDSIKQVKKLRYE